MFWRLLARPVPTCFLQEELATRESVSARRLSIGEAATIVASGPCIVTVNHD